ncbi:MAG: sugar phosphate isomerase/epimerase [Oscillospiraceae bacterium]|nr:sugar phosphate isomerase/epimerase [Oscillospiraceae bacterium]
MKISTNGGYILSRFGYEKGFALLKEAGFDAVDVGLDEMTSMDSLLNQPGYEKKAQEIRRAADNAGIPVNQTHAPFKDPLDVWEKNENLYQILKRSLEVSGILGAEIAVVHPYHHPVFLGHEDEMFEKNMAYYGELLPTAIAAKVKIGVENMYRVDSRRRYIVDDTCSRLYDFIRYVDTLNSPWAVACLDIGHVAVIRQKDEPWDFIRGLGHDRLKALHVHDNDYVGDQHKLPYEGLINWNEVTRALGEIDYQGYFTYETIGHLGACDDDFIPTALKYMADLAKYLADKAESCRTPARL